MKTTFFTILMVINLTGQFANGQTDTQSRWSYQPGIIFQRNPNTPDIVLPHIEDYTIETLKAPLNVNLGFDINFKLGRKRQFELFLSNEFHIPKYYVERATWDNDKQSGIYTQTTKSSIALAGYFGARYHFRLSERLSIAPSIIFPMYALGIQYRSTYKEEITMKQTGAVYVGEGFSSGLGSESYKIVGGLFAITNLTPRLDFYYRLNSKFSLNTYFLPSITKYHYPDGVKRKVGFHSIGIGLRYTPSLKKH